MRNKDLDGLGERETFLVVYKYLVDKYKLTGNKEDNKLRLEGAGYVFNDEIIGYMREGKFVKTDSVLDENSGTYRQTSRTVNTHTHGIELLHSVDVIKTTIGMTAQKTKIILERLFRKNVLVPHKLLSLTTPQYYAFVINNEHTLKVDFREATASLAVQTGFLEPKTMPFTIPEQELYRYDPTETDVEEMLSSAYKDYSSAMIVEGIRSKSERLFERYCEQQTDIEWVYKNGDTGQQYFSVVYIDSIVL